MFDETLARIGASLERAAIPYMIIGGQAVLLYGEPRLTRDIDITLGVNVDRLETILAVAKEEWLKTFDAASDEKNFLVTFRELSGGK